MKQISITLLLLAMLAGSTWVETIPTCLQGDHGLGGREAQVASLCVKWVEKIL